MRRGAWRRRGVVLPACNGQLEWARSHASVPLIQSSDPELTVMFSPRDVEGRSHTARATVQLAAGKAAPAIEPDPILRPGALGAFDDAGAMGSSIVHAENRMFLYYIGWTLGRTVPFHTQIGLAISDDGGHTFERVSSAPVLGRNRLDPFITTSPFVIRDEDAWRMWYAGGSEWRATPQGPRHFYNIRYAESDDGMSWRPTGVVCIDHRDSTEYAIARPWVIKEDGIYRMWYCCRGDHYRIGYAESGDGLQWRRMDDVAGLDVEESGWDSEMVEYPCTFDRGGTRYMLYNGNDYGRTGIGLATMEKHG